MATKTENTTAKTEKPVQEKAIDPWKDLVPVKLFKDSGEYSGDVFVSVNGRNFQIQRGVEVKVPRCVADVLAHSEYQDQNAAAVVDKLVREYANQKV